MYCPICKKKEEDCKCECEFMEQYEHSCESEET